MPIYDTNAYLQAGVQLDNKKIKYGNSIGTDGKPIKEDPLKYNLKYDSLFEIMRNHNRIEILERYQWINVPPGLTQDLIERILFYRGKGVFYFNDKVGKFQFLPFALNKIIDEYGRYTSCNTYSFTGVDSDEGNDNKVRPKSKGDKQRNYIYEDLEIVYDLPYCQEMIDQINKKKIVGIILNDSSLGLGQQPIIRSNYVLPILRSLATLMQIINTAMFGCADHNLIQIQNQGQLLEVKKAIEGINQDILRGNRFTAFVGEIAIQALKTNNTANLEGLFNTFNSLNNFLKQINGIANAGVFDKKAHLLQSEQDLNGSNADDIYYNGLRLRQEFCLMVQAYYDYPVWCESKRGLTEAQIENVEEGETDNPDNTQQMEKSGGNENGNY